MPPLPPPPVYVPTSELKEGSVASFAATVLHFAAPAPTKGTGLLVKLKVADGTGVEPVSVLIFRNRATELPVVTAVGDILCFTHMRMGRFESSLQAVSTSKSRFSVFRGEPGATLTPTWSEPGDGAGALPTPDETAAVVSLRKRLAGQYVFGVPIPGAAAPPPPSAPSAPAPADAAAMSPAMGLSMFPGLAGAAAFSPAQLQMLSLMTMLAAAGGGGHGGGMPFGLGQLPLFPYGGAPPAQPATVTTAAAAGMMPGGMSMAALGLGSLLGGGYEAPAAMAQPPPARARSPPPPPPPPPPPAPVLPTGAMRRMMQVQDLRPGVFCDTVVELVSMRTDARNVAAIVTDYTAPYAEAGGAGYGEAAGRGLLVTFWDQHADSVRSLAPGAYLHVINLKVKRNRYGELEGALHSGAYSKLAILSPSHPLVLPLLTRKGGPDAVAAAMMHAAEHGANENRPPAPPSDERDLKRARFEPITAPVSVPIPPPAPAPAPPAPVQAQPLVPASPVRPVVRLAVRPSAAPCSLADIVTDTATSNMYVTRGHVVAALPLDRRLWCQLYCHRCRQLLPQSTTATHCPACVEGPPAPLAYVWTGMLCVADADAELAVLIFAEDGNTLLPGLPPSDLARADATRTALEGALSRLLGRTNNGSAAAGVVAWGAGHHRRKTVAERDAWLAQTATLGPSIELCVKAYTITTPAGPQRRFRICNSILT